MFRIAIDGTAAAGKGTLAQLCSKVLGFMYVDTGAMYRGVALKALEAGVDVSDEAGHAQIAHRLQFEFDWNGDSLQLWIDGEDASKKIRTEAVGDRASTSSAFPSVRAALLEQQRALGAAQSVIMDGRDIGTVVLPNAELKVYVDADIRVRAERRLVDVQQKDATVSFEQVLSDLQKRDERDMNRAIAPLRRADDARLLDTTEQSILEGVLTVVLWYFELTNLHLPIEQLRHAVSGKAEIMGLSELEQAQIGRLKNLFAAQA